MLLLDYLNVGLKNLYKRKVRTFLTVLGLSIGMFLLTVMISIFFGARAKINEMFDLAEMEKIARIIFVSPHITTIEKETKQEDLIREVQGDEVQSRHKGIPLGEIERIQKMPHVQAIAKTMELNTRSVRLKNSNKSFMVRASGVTVNEEFGRNIKYGRDFQLSDYNAAVLPAIYVNTFGAADPQDLIGQTLVLNVEREHHPNTEFNIDLDPHDFVSEAAFRAEFERRRLQLEKELREKPLPNQDFEAVIIGITGGKGFGDDTIYLPMAWAKDIKLWSRYNEDRFNEIETEGNQMIQALVDDVENVEQVVDGIQGLNLGVESMKRSLRETYEGLFGIALGFGIFALISLLVAGIGVINVMIMSIYERTREIGIMKATGANHVQIKHLFMIESGLLGVFGGVLGMLAAKGGMSLAAYIINTYVMDPEKRLMDPMFAGGSFDLFVFPAGMHLAVLAFAFLFGLFVGWYPARRAAKMDPVEALRYE